MKFFFNEENGKVEYTPYEADAWVFADWCDANLAKRLLEIIDPGEWYLIPDDDGNITEPLPTIIFKHA